MLFYLMEYADWVVTFMIVFVMVTFFVGLHYLVLRITPSKKSEYEIASIITHLIGMLYAVLLGFIAVSSWGDFDHASQNAKVEENAIADLYRLTSDFPANNKEAIQKDILLYAQLMTEKEWPAMQHGSQSQEAYTVALRIINEVNGLQPTSSYDSNVQSVAFSLAHSFLDARRARLSKNDEGMPPMLWWVLLIGAIFMIGFTFYLRQNNYLHQLFMTGVLAALIGLLFSLILEFEYPFRGKLAVSSKGWTKLVDNIEANQLY